MRRRYDRQGMLAIEPKAFFWLFDEPEKPQTELAGDVAIVDVRGPLDHHEGWWCDSYDAIRDRVKAACDMAAHTVLLKLDSPGGDVSGCFETARELRSLCAAAGKRLVAYVDGQACSGAYALACAAEQIVVPETGFVGSVGVINTRIDVTGNDAQYGVKFAVTTSGERKADGHPHTPVSEGESAATQTIVNSLAEVFFDVVSELRGVPQQHLAALQAGVFHGKAAVEAKLADSVSSFDALLAELNAGASTRKPTMKITKIDDARSALEEAAKGEGADAEKAKRALKALDDEPPKDEEEPAVEEPAEEEPKEEPACRAASRATRGRTQVSATTAGELAAKVSEHGKEIGSLKLKLESTERREFLTEAKKTHDITPELEKLLEAKPLAEVKAIVNAMPKRTVPALAAAAQVQGTRGATQGTGAASGKSGLSPEREAEIDRMSGLVKQKNVVRVQGNRQILGDFVDASTAGKDNAE